MPVLRGKKKFLFIIFIFSFLTTYQFKINYSLPILKIKTVNFIGCNNFEENVKDEVVNFLLKKNIFNLDNKKLLKLFYKSKWLKGYKIKKKYPDHIDIIIEEHKPIAILHNNFFLINDDYVVTNKMYNKNYSNLIYIKGVFKREKFKKVFTNLKNSKIFSEITELHFLKLGRWDIYLKNKVHVKMGDYNIVKQIDILFEVLNKKKGVRNIDLRTEGIIIINEK